jgi:hypothetical protein
MAELRNYIGGTIDDPCPTGPTAFKIFGSLYCNAEDYAAWKTRLQVMYQQAILPTWNAYLAIVPDGAPLLLARVERFQQAYNDLPPASNWMGVSASARNSQQAIAIGQDGELTIELLQVEIEKAGEKPPAFALPGPKAAPGKHPLLPWGLGILMGSVVAGAAVYGLTSRPKKRRRR